MYVLLLPEIRQPDNDIVTTARANDCLGRVPEGHETASAVMITVKTADGVIHCLRAESIVS